MTEDKWLDVVVREAIRTGPDTLLIRLSAKAGVLPPYEPGAHVAVQCGEGLTRYYSLTGGRAEPQVYELGVKLSPDTRGGSKWVFENARPGATLRISEPRNHFPLVEGAPRYLFLSGGIGITPLVSMLYHLRTQGVKARMVHMCRTREELAFGAWLQELSAFHDIHVHFDSAAGALFDLASELRGSHPETAVYCCGPASMMKAVQRHGCDASREQHYHFEFFSGPELSAAEAGADAEFTVVQASTGKRIPVPKTRTMLAAIRDAGIEMKSECEYGVCGWCAVPVVAGTPQHFDSYLTAAERESNKLVLPCVSRCASASLTLEI